MFASVCGKTPRDQGAAFVADSAVVVGDVTLAPGSTVWYGAVVRGDEGSIYIGENTNVQDNAVLHCDTGSRIVLHRDVTVGHGAIVHGAEVGEGTLIGMHATLLNGCKVGKGCIIGAGALVPEGKEIPDHSVAVGVPARVVLLNCGEGFVPHGATGLLRRSLSLDGAGIASKVLEVLGRGKTAT